MKQSSWGDSLFGAERSVLGSPPYPQPTLTTCRPPLSFSIRPPCPAGDGFHFHLMNTLSSSPVGAFRCSWNVENGWGEQFQRKEVTQCPIHVRTAG